jgi:hypothetical protein
MRIPGFKFDAVIIGKCLMWCGMVWYGVVWCVVLLCVVLCCVLCGADGLAACEITSEGILSQRVIPVLFSQPCHVLFSGYLIPLYKHIITHFISYPLLRVQEQLPFPFR